jgi:hypothetical protein
MSLWIKQSFVPFDPQINGSLARRAIARGLIRMVFVHSSQQIYTRATNTWGMFCILSMLSILDDLVLLLYVKFIWIMAQSNLTVVLNVEYFWNYWTILSSCWHPNIYLDEEYQPISAPLFGMLLSKLLCLLSWIQCYLTNVFTVQVSVRCLSCVWTHSIQCYDAPPGTPCERDYYWGGHWVLHWFCRFNWLDWGSNITAIIVDSIHRSCMHAWLRYTQNQPLIVNGSM